MISLAQLMLVLDELIVNTALPHLQRALHFSGTRLEWVVTGYAVTFGGLLLLGGRAGDILGRRRMLRTGIAVFTAASLRGGLAYLPFIGGFIVTAGLSSRLIPRVGVRMPMTIGALLAPVSMFWLSRVHEHSSYLTGICLPLMLFAATAGLIFVPLTMILVARISDEDAGVASSMFNAGQQVGGAIGLAVIGTAAWTVVSSHVRNAVSHLAAGPAGGSIRIAAAVRPGGPVYGHALSSGVSAALTIGAGSALLALVVTLAAIRVCRADLPSAPPVI